MIQVQTVIDALEAKLTLLRKLDGQEVSGFALVIPPDGKATEILLMGSELDNAAFYKIMVSHLGQAGEAAQYGATHRRIP